jgi:hypothetical protein
LLGGGLERFGYYHLILTRKIHFAYPLISFLKLRSAHAKSGKWLLVKLLVSIFPTGKPYPRAFLPAMIPYYGPQWCTWSMEAINHIISYLDKNKAFYNFFKYTHIPDEMFFQSLLLNTAEKALKDNIINDSFHYAHWVASGDHPENIAIEDLEEILKSGYFIARKLEAENDMTILDKIDQICNQSN